MGPITADQGRQGASAGCRVVFAVDSSRRTMGRRRRSLPMWTTHSAEPAVHPIKRNGSAHVPAGTSQRAQRLNATRKRSSCCAEGPVEERAGFQHRMHRDRQFACNRNCGALKADPLPEFEAPGPQAAVGRAAGQDDRCRFIRGARKAGRPAPRQARQRQSPELASAAVFPVFGHFESARKIEGRIEWLMHLSFYLSLYLSSAPDSPAVVPEIYVGRSASVYWMGASLAPSLWPRSLSRPIAHARPPRDHHRRTPARRPQRRVVLPALSSQRANLTFQRLLGLLALSLQHAALSIQHAALSIQHAALTYQRGHVQGCFQNRIESATK